MAMNMYLEYRSRASKDNSTLRTRAEAAEILGISESSLSNYETGRTKVVPPEMVAQMARLYNAPELRNIYCSRVCPVGCRTRLAVHEPAIEQAVIHLLNSFDIQKRFGELITIAQDGRIDEKRFSCLSDFSKAFDNVVYAVSEFQILVERKGVEWI